MPQPLQRPPYRICRIAGGRIARPGGWFSESLLATVRLSAKCCNMVAGLAFFAKLLTLANSKTCRVSSVRTGSVGGVAQLVRAAES